MQTRPARAERREVDLRGFVSGFLRMSPDIAIVGEVRDREGSRRRGNRRCRIALRDRTGGGVSRRGLSNARYRRGTGCSS
ncbi:MAG: Flp pilus assembly complex ATPase component TadA [Acidimicrobiia bacterium]|nr:Flp pilus assembly complex ATPase component TadA [Acidimicrobiia bacterium]